AVGPGLSAIPATSPAISIKPRTPFEDVGGPVPVNVPDHPQIQSPKLGVAEISRGAAPGGPAVPAENPDHPGGSQLQLLSDPQGLDFKPYFIGAAANVNPQWRRLVPVDEIRRGEVTIQFSIGRDGRASKTKITKASNIPNFELWAVAAIRAAYF